MMSQEHCPPCQRCKKFLEVLEVLERITRVASVELAVTRPDVIAQARRVLEKYEHIMVSTKVVEF